jgi:hypothetical protein
VVPAVAATVKMGLLEEKAATARESEIKEGS